MQKKIRLFMRRYWLFGMAGCLVFFVSIINVFPNGFTFSGGDVEQYFNLDYAIKNFGYTWSNLLGEGFFLQYFSYNLYYFPIYLASSFFKVSLSQQSFFYFFIFLFFSFCSFYFALSFFTKDKIEKVNFKYKILFSLVYTFNTYTFYNFYYTWGYSPFLFLYVLIPVMFGATYQFFGELTKKIDYKNLSILGMFFFLSNIANGNMPFFISLNILLFLFIAGLFVIKNGKSNIFLFLRKTLTYYFVYLLAIFWSVIPQIPEMFRQLNIYSQNEGVFDLKKWLLWQSVKFSNIFFISSGTKEFIKDMEQDYERYKYYAEKGVPAEDARYKLPNACETKIVVSMNPRSLHNFFKERLCIRAQWEIRAMAREMLKLAEKKAPILFSNVGPSCETDLICRQGKRSCGKWKAIKGAHLVDPLE